ncbi:glycosyltransferase [Bacillus sp. FJAT-49732]|uniref:Glycosyltransferase n=1 Tax=Lederbergia citrisecunda TaxID=2833583 RepID=A0A942TLW9_9BACI|nr:glycosyltransferase [Lederbergia citrisecunda]MBS4200595.1 glycosyltransferase [Lederbergia citrisecunda]
MRKNFLFLGFAIPDEEMKSVMSFDKFPAIQTHKFNWNLIKGMEVHDIYNYTYISARPVSDYPFFSEKKIKSKKWSVDVFNKKIEITEIYFINSSILKIFTRFFSGLYYSIKKYHRIKEKGGVIVYSVHLPFMLIGYIVSRLYNIDYIAIWTDPPSVRSERESFLKSKLRKIEYLFSKILMNKASKVIALTKYLADDFAPKKPCTVIEGIIDEKDINPNIKKERIEGLDFFKIVYTGSIEKRYGIKNIVEGFRLVKNENIILEIYGRGDYEDELKKVSTIDERIRYRGFVSNEDILKIQRGADFLINARSAEDEYVKYSFPSKTLEYMLSGTPLITTMLPGIPEEYKNYVLVLKDNSPLTICNMLKKVIKLEIEERYLIGFKALEFAKGKNYINQGKKIIDTL